MPLLYIKCWNGSRESVQGFYNPQLRPDLRRHLSIYAFLFVLSFYNLTLIFNMFNGNVLVTTNDTSVLAMLVYYISHDFIPYWNVRKHRHHPFRTSQCVTPLDYVRTRYSNAVTTSFNSDYVLCFTNVCWWPMDLGTTPNTGLSFSRITTCVNDTTQAPDYAGPGLWYRQLRWIVCLLRIQPASGLSVDESPCLPASWQPSPTPPPPFFFSRF